MKRWAMIGVTWVLCSSCGGPPVEIRFENASEQTFDSLEVGFGEESAVFEGLAPGELTEYREFEDAYRYGYVRVVIGEDEFELRPIDYVGESRLDPGKYTHRLEFGPPPSGLRGATWPDE